MPKDTYLSALKSTLDHISLTPSRFGEFYILRKLTLELCKEKAIAINTKVTAFMIIEEKEMSLR